jgi:hypothetical protein
MNQTNSSWEKVKANPTLYPSALLPGEGESFHWHPDANLPHSSQVFCVSAFGSIRNLPVKDQIVSDLLGQPEHEAQRSSWSIQLEVERPELLTEYGSGQASSIDVLLLSSTCVICIESKFLTDAKAGFGKCSQTKEKNCAGHFGPGSDLKTKTNAWCRLEVWDRDRSPRAYWSLGRAFFRESVYEKQSEGKQCPFDGPNYQLMRNFLFAASISQQKKLHNFGVVVMSPERTAGKLVKQIEEFRNTILQLQFHNQIQLLTYEKLIVHLRQSQIESASNLADFLSSRITALVP